MVPRHLKIQSSIPNLHHTTTLCFYSSLLCTVILFCIFNPSVSFSPPIILSAPFETMTREGIPPRTSLFHVKMEETDTGNAWPQTPRLSDAEHQTSLGQTEITRLSETWAVPVHVQFTPRTWSHLPAILNTHLPCLPSAGYKEGHTPRSACLPEIAASHSLTRDAADQSSAADTNSWIYAPSKLSTKKWFFFNRELVAVVEMSSMALLPPSNFLGVMIRMEASPFLDLLHETTLLGYRSSEIDSLDIRCTKNLGLLGPLPIFSALRGFFSIFLSK